MYATRSATCVFEITGPQTGMKGRFGFFDSPRPCVMIFVSALHSQRLADDVQRRHERRDAAAAEVTVAGRTRELDEVVCPGSDVRVDPRR